MTDASTSTSPSDTDATSPHHHIATLPQLPELLSVIRNPKQPKTSQAKLAAMSRYYAKLCRAATLAGVPIGEFKKWPKEQRQPFFNVADDKQTPEQWQAEIRKHYEEYTKAVIEQRVDELEKRLRRQIATPSV